MVEYWGDGRPVMTSLLTKEWVSTTPKLNDRNRAIILRYMYLHNKRKTAAEFGVSHWYVKQLFQDAAVHRYNEWIKENDQT